MKDLEKLNMRPFSHFCMSIGAVPSSYLASLTIEGQLLWLCSFIEKEVVPIVNNNSDATKEIQDLFLELKDYVNHYFDNLDVQEEINNKLDEMAESGELETIISAYLNSNCVLGFDTLDDLKDSQNLIDGAFARTYGKLTYNDKLGAFYKIRTKTNEDVIDDVNIVGLNNYETLIAELCSGYNNLILGFDTVSDMQIADNLVNGAFARTLGESTYNDQNGAFYKIREKTIDDVVDGVNIVALTNYPDLVAEICSSKLQVATVTYTGDNETNQGTVKADFRCYNNLVSVDFEFSNVPAESMFTLVGSNRVPVPDFAKPRLALATGYLNGKSAQRNGEYYLRVYNYGTGNSGVIGYYHNTDENDMPEGVTDHMTMVYIR